MMRSLPTCLLFLSILAPASSAEPVEMRWQFKKGQVLKYLLKHREVRTIGIADQKIEVTSTSAYDWQWTVQEVDDQGTATMEQKLTGLHVDYSGKDFELHYDSARGNESDDDYKKKAINFFDQLRYGASRVKLRRDGRVVEVYGLDKVINETTNGSTVADFHALDLHDESFAWFLQLALGALPERAVEPGAKWQLAAPPKLAGFGAMTGQTSFTLEKGTEIKLTGEQTLDLDTKFAESVLRGTLKTSKLAGTVRFDPKAGMVRGSSVQVDFAGDLKFGANDPPLVLKVGFQHTLELEAR